MLVNSSQLDGGDAVENPVQEPAQTSPEPGGTDAAKAPEASTSQQPAAQTATDQQPTTPADGTADDLQPTVEDLRRQLRAVSRERNAERQRANELQQQLGITQAGSPATAAATSPQPGMVAPQTPAAQAAPHIPTFTAPPPGTGYLVLSSSTELGGLLYDPIEQTVCIGNPDDPKDWVAEHHARAVVQAQRLEQQVAQMRQASATAEATKAFDVFVQTMSDNALKLRSAAFPNITDPAAVAKIDKQIADLTLVALRNQGVTVEQIAAGDPSTYDRAADALAEVIRGYRDSHVQALRQAAATDGTARATAPVSGASASAGITQGTPLSEMTPTQRASALEKLADTVLG